MESSTRFFCLLFSLFLASVAVADAHIGKFDEYWQERAALARANAEAAYTPDPHSVANLFNDDVHKAVESTNSTRRALRGKGPYEGPCLSTNPIDRCWRCRADWAENRKLLATCGKGFGRNVTGGADGEIYVVTDASDDDLVNPKNGTLRFGVIQDRPLWIIFARDMIIHLTEELIINSNKTLDGRGVNVRIINGPSLTIQYVSNIIIHNLHIHDIKPSGGGIIRDSETHYGLRTVSDGDGISIFGASNIWIDHVSMSNCADGLIDAIQGSTAITISNSHFTQHNDVMLFGANDAHSEDAIMQVTVAFNHFGRGLVQRMPRCRWGFFHVLNNDYTHWLMYAIGGSMHPTILSQGNRFLAPPNAFAKEVTKRYTDESEWKSWSWTSEGDELANGAYFVQSGEKDTRDFTSADIIKAKPGSYVSRLTRFSGALDCEIGKPC